MTTVAGQDWVARAVALGPVIEQDLVAAEERGTIGRDTAEALVASGIPWMTTPIELGGAGVDVLEAMEAIEEISRLHASVGWCAMTNIGMAGIVSSLLSDAGVREIFLGARLPLIAGAPQPVGRAVPVRGGYEVQGDYRLASAAPYSSWLASGAVVELDGQPVLTASGAPTLICFVLPSDRVELRGGWNSLGLKATGSVAYRVNPQIVSEDFVWSGSDHAPLRGGAIYAAGPRASAAAGQTAVAFGAARRALEEIVALAPNRQRGSGPPIAEQPLFLSELAWHDAALRGARAYLRAVAECIEGQHNGGEGCVSDVLVDRMRQAGTYGHRVAGDVARFAYRWAGAGALAEPSTLGRCLRDLEALNQHAAVDPNSMVDAAASVMRSTDARHPSFSLD